MKKLFAISLFMLTLALVNCKDESTDDPTPAKTLNKSLLTNKYWSSGLFSHYFRSDGNYCGKDGKIVIGTWNWVNNSDTLAVDYSGITDDELWQGEYITETEMKATIVGDKSYEIFTKQ